MIACTPDESQKTVDVRSVTTMPTPGSKAAISWSYTWSQLVTSISAGSATTAGTPRATWSSVT
jgi:hypothetical protein